MVYKPQIIYEDNHFIAINKKPGELVQSDKTGDISLETNLKDFIKKRDSKPGNVFLGVCHRIDRPVSGVVVFAKTGKALTRVNEIFREKEVKKIYWAIVKNKPADPSGTLVHHLMRDTSRNRTMALKRSGENTKEASLTYKIIGSSDNYFLLGIELHTGRHHQIRCQLAKIGSPLLGDVKYGFPRSFENGGIGLHSREVSFIHPVSLKPLSIRADTSGHVLWKEFMKEKHGFLKN